MVEVSRTSSLKADKLAALQSETNVMKFRSVFCLDGCKFAMLTVTKKSGKLLDKI